MISTKNSSSSFIAQPYPNTEITRENIISSAFVGLLVFIFLVVFQPFGTHNFSHPYKYLLLLIYGLITFLAFVTLNSIFSKKKDWTVGKEIGKVLLALLISSFFSYLYNCKVISHVELSISNFLYMLIYTLAIGIPIAVIYILGRYIYLRNKYQLLANKYTTQLESNSTKEKVQENSNELFEINTDNKKKALVIATNDFLYAESADNYCHVHYLLNKKANKETIRLSLNSLVLQTNHPCIKRCHRSFIINLNQVKKIKGNAQGYKLLLNEIEEEIPVSRNYINEIVPLLSINN
jgi:DNA-binding LytR/AlgR family response regulator